MARTTVQVLWRNRAINPEFRSGVSLHSHTMYSEESLEALSHHLCRLPCAALRLLPGTRLDPSHAYWTPPLPPRRAYRLEEKQIHRRLQLPALVSLSDHDDIRAATLLRVIDRFCHVPISTEWTVPFGSTFFHVGVHNLPLSCAAAIHRELAACTATPNPKKLKDALALLNSHPDVLIVLNHPLWDEKRLGCARHARMLHRFLMLHSGSLHALELNGIRCWRENQAILELASDLGLPAISGGDRHAREPNAILNLSRATSFTEFVHEIRKRRRSHVVLMPQYRKPRTLRILQMVREIIADYPDMPGRVSWRDRVFIRNQQTGACVSLS